MEGEVVRGAQPLFEPGLILSGPDDSFLDNIFDWIANAATAVLRTVTDWVGWAASSITSAVTSWITWLWNNITSWFSSVFTRLIQVRDYVVSWVSTKVGELWNWISRS